MSLKILRKFSWNFLLKIPKIPWKILKKLSKNPEILLKHPSKNPENPLKNPEKTLLEFPQKSWNSLEKSFDQSFQKNPERSFEKSWKIPWKIPFCKSPSNPLNPKRKKNVLILGNLFSDPEKILKRSRKDPVKIPRKHHSNFREFLSKIL